MKGLKDTFANLARLRGRFERLLSSAAKRGTGAPAASPRHRETTVFGSNPGNLRMFSHVPKGLSKAPALVVALHGCTQTAAAYDYGSGWSDLADSYGFAVLFPEQQRSNNPNNCFNWFLPSDTARNRGEAHSVRQMIERVIIDNGIDRSRVFVVGLSAGGAMASAMLAVYPDVFAGGAIIAGLPFASATNVQEAFEVMAKGGSVQVRNGVTGFAPLPRIVVHGQSCPFGMAPPTASSTPGIWKISSSNGQMSIACPSDPF